MSFIDVSRRAQISDAPRHFSLGGNKDTAFRMVPWQVGRFPYLLPANLLGEQIDPGIPEMTVNLLGVGPRANLCDCIYSLPIFDWYRFENSDLMTFGVQLDQIATLHRVDHANDAHHESIEL